MNNMIPVIDLFAGPGGLGEGFSAFEDVPGHRPFKIALSIEKETSAHSTLELRAFFRELEETIVPDDYYNYLRGQITKDELFKRYPYQYEKAQKQAWQFELGRGDSSNKEIDKRIEKAIDNNDNWILIGGPPCQAYSIVGRSRRKKESKSEFESDERHFLYREYLRIVAVHKPPIFIMENVKGILSSKINGEKIFNKILFDLRHPDKALSHNNKSDDQNDQYKIYSLVKTVQNDRDLQPADYIIKSENYGIPQKRHRVILLGIKSNNDIKPEIITESTEKCPIENVIYDLPKLRSGVSKEIDSPELWKSILESIPKLEWTKDNCIHSELMSKFVSYARNIDVELTRGSRYSISDKKPEYKPDWFYDEKLAGVCNHTSRKHIRSDLYRYFFASCFADLYNRSPQLYEFPVGLLPAHKNISKGVTEKLFSDRFRVQIVGKPSTTVVSHISKDGHYYIHPDPCQCRSLSVREAARLQTFKDNYFFEGTQTQQYQQVGNAVPPLLALQIAKVVFDLGVCPSKNSLLL
jgi:DNA (cytosine-5)-methyltransferase 1